jgi:NAD(P)H-hydrate epimerase
MSIRLKTVRSIPTLTSRPREAHKGDFGRVLIVGGSIGMVGAPALAANAALRGGAGLVKIACPRCSQQATATLAPCATSIPLPCTKDGVISAEAVKQLKDVSSRHDILAIGPGMGRGGGVRKVVATLLGLPDKPKVVDADGLNALAESGQWWHGATGPIVLTPHPGEMQRLIAGAKVQVDPQDRQACAAAFSALTNAIVLLKGAGTVVTDARRVYVNKTGNPGMATAGAGDVLTGLIAALIGQHLPAFDAAVLGAYLHGLAGDLAAHELGQISLTAGDLLDFMPEAFSRLRKSK